MKKYYKAIKSSFLWEKGAILEPIQSGNGYAPISNIWDATENNNEEYVTSIIIENSPEWFQQVYPVNLLSKVVYKSKEQARAVFAKEYLGE